jgi:two-component system response regulator AtoC
VTIADLLAEIDDLRSVLAKAGGPLAGLVGRTAPMQELFERILRSAGRPSPVTIWGESGTGRSAVAAAVHALSRRTGPYRTLRAEAGFVPGAREIQAAWFGAGGGTLVVDGVTQFPDSAQQELARRCTDGSGVRLIVISRVEPDLALAERRIREDLADRAGVHTIPLPPLRRRKADIPLLSDFFLREAAGPAGGPPGVDSRAVEAMMAHEWPGNVRELRNVMRRAAALTDGPWIGLTTIQSLLGRSSSRADDGAAGVTGDDEVVLVRVGDSMAEVERRMLQRTLQFAQGNKRKAAELLELSLKTIYNKIREYGLERDFNRRLRKAPRSD